MRLTLAHRAVDMLTQSMTFRLTSVQLTLADGAVDVLTQSMTFFQIDFRAAYFG